MNYLIKKNLLIYLFVFSGFVLNAQENIPPLKAQILPGFQQVISGEQMRFHSASPQVNDVLLARSIKSHIQMSWLTADIPTNYKGEYAYFVWHAGLATGKNRQSNTFAFYINDKLYFDLNIIVNDFPQNWQLTDDDGTTLRFKQLSVDSNRDCFGYMYLKVPVSKYAKGKPLTLKIKGKDIYRYDDYMMAFRSREQEEVKAVAQPLLRKVNNQSEQLIQVQVNHILPDALKATISMGGKSEKEVLLNTGFNEFEYWVPAVSKETVRSIKLNIPKVFESTQSLILQPVVRGYNRNELIE